MEKVLVLLSAYNGEKYLETQLNSLMRQVGIDVYVLVRDDGSTDQTVQILEKYKEMMSLKYYSSGNIGSVKSFMELIQVCEEDFAFYALCDQDDYWHSDKLKEAIDRLNDFDLSRPALYYSGQNLVDEKLQPIYVHCLDNQRSPYANLIFNQMAGCTAVFNKALMQELKKCYTPDSVPGFHDSYIYKMNVLLHGQFYCEPYGKIDYRQHGSNVVGLDYSFKGKVNKLIKYLKPSEFQQDMMYITEKKQIEDPFVKHLFYANHSVKDKMWLLTHQNAVHFHSTVLRGIYIYKILFSKF